MSEDYAMNWLVKHYGEAIGTWPLGMVKKCAEMMTIYQAEMVDFKMKQLAKEQMAQASGHATVTPEQQSSSAKPSDTTPAKKTVIVGG